MGARRVRSGGKEVGRGSRGDARPLGRVILVTVLMLLFLSCGQPPVLDNGGAASERAGVLFTVGSGTEEVPIHTVSERPLRPFIGGRLLETDTRNFSLKGTARGGLMGWLAPLGVPSPDGTMLAYNSWQDLAEVDPEESYSAQGIEDGQPLSRPSIRIVDLTTEEDTLLRDGAFSLAWRRDGMIAYFAGTVPEYRANESYTGQILVQESLTAAPAQWTVEPARYIVYAWGGDRLIAYQEHEGEHLDVLVIDGPGQVRVLAGGANIVSLSPDGNRILVSDEAGPGLRLLDIATGDEVSRIDVGTAALPSSSVEWLGYGGSWEGDQIAAKSNVGVVLIQVTGDRISVELVLQLTPVPFPMGVHEPQLVGSGGDQVVMWAPLDVGNKRTTAFLECDLEGETCKEGPRLDRVAYSQAYNPSRPR